MGLTSDPAARMRIDKWLWAARFFKTRSLASQAIDGGHIRLNGSPVKPARELHIGDTLSVTIGDQEWALEVRALNDQRRPAEEARQLYCESEDSRIRREQAREARKLAPTPGSELRGRPTKKARRQIRSFNEGYE